MSDAPANTPPRRFSRPRPRLRKTAKWGGLILSILLVAAWIASGSYVVFWTPPGRLVICVVAGTIGGWDRGYTYPTQSPVEALGPIVPPRWYWRFADSGPGNRDGVMVPFWAITLPTIALTIFAWRRDAAARRRALHNHCPACGYDRAGLLTPDAVCPECGAAAPTAVRL